MTGNAEDRLMTIEELSEYVGLEVGTIYNRVHRKAIPYEKAGRLLRFRKSKIDAWLGEHRDEAGVEPEGNAAA